MFYGNEAALTKERGRESLLTLGTVAFLDRIHNHFEDKRRALLKEKSTVEKKNPVVFKGMQPTVIPVSKSIEEEGTEVTGPAYKHMILKAFYAKADLFVANFKHKKEVSWEKSMEWQKNLYDAIHRQNGFLMSEYQATKLAVRPRCLDMNEENLTKEGLPMSASFVDFGIYMFHNAKMLLEHGKRPHFYLSDIQSHLEARLWNDLFIYAQNDLQIPQGSIQVTLVNESITNEEKLNDILYELNEHSTTIYYTI